MNYQSKPLRYSLTESAFAKYREGRLPQEMCKEVQRYDGDTDQMTQEDGLHHWCDAPSAVAPEKNDNCLWVVTKDNVFYAKENCNFGSERQAKKIKHSNITGGQPAFSGGEVSFLNDRELLISGSSGRYRIKKKSDLLDVYRAFNETGYKLYAMGWNEDVQRPEQFGNCDPEWVI